MKYLLSDYYFLCGATHKETRTVGDAYRKMCTYLNGSATCACLLHALRGLSSGGYISFEPEAHGEALYVNLGSPIKVTEAGRKAVAVSPLQRMFGERKAFVKNQLAFCSLDRPETTANDGWWVDSDCLLRINCNGVRDGEWSAPLFSLGDIGDGSLGLTLHRSGYAYTDGDGESNIDPDAAEQTDRVNLSGDAESIMQGVSDLLSATHALLTEAPRTRKVALHSFDRSFIVSLAHAAGDQGSFLRMTVAPILYNRKRFYGKRDGELDYAQCGAPLITMEFSNVYELAARLLPLAVSLPERLSETDLETVDAISKLIL